MNERLALKWTSGTRGGHPYWRSGPWKIKKRENGVFEIWHSMRRHGGEGKWIDFHPLMRSELQVLSVQALIQELQDVMDGRYSI